MDLDYLENALSNMELKQQQIYNVADYCMTNNVNNQMEISKLIQQHFYKHTDPKAKTALFLLSSDLFLLANLRKNKLFFKHLSPNIRPFIENLIPDALQNLQIGSLIMGAVEKWATDQLFADSFMDKIKDAVNPIFTRIQEERAGGGKHQKFLKYKKTFLMQLMDVKKYAPTSYIYDTYVAIADLNLKINSFQQAYSKIDFQSPSQDAIKRAKQLQRMSDDYSQKLQNLICDLHKEFKMLSDECSQDFAKLSIKK